MNQKVDFPEIALPVSAELNDQLKQLAPGQLIWLSGYCAGLAGYLNAQSVGQLQGQAGADADHVADAKGGSASELATTTLIGWASQTGNAEKIAEQLASNLNESGIAVQATNLLKLKPKTLAQYKQIILVASTHGEGEPPDNAISFHEFLRSKRAPSLKGHKYAVLGLGDSSYEFYCQTAKDFDQRLAELGAEPLVDRVDCDVDFEESARLWVEQVAAALKALAPAEAVAPQKVENVATTSTPVWNKNNPFSAEILVNQVITGEGSEKCVHHIELDISGSGISYQPGDGLGVWPQNSQSDVDTLLSILQLDAEQIIENNGQARSIREWLTRFLEISQIHKPGIEWLIERSENVTQLKNALNDFTNYKHNHQWIDLLNLAQLPSFNADDLFSLFKPIKPRVYSIASSPLVDEEEVHITVGLAETDNESRHLLGCASSHLIQDLAVGDKLQVYLEPNKHFRLPEPERPIIMIGPGTGIAPFRAFLQHREEQEAVGGNWLFFGNPHFNTDFLYQTEIQSFLQDGILSRIDLAFSRDQSEKIYVQDRMLQQSADLWQWINEKGAAVYVCGDANRMAKDVEATLLNVIRQEGALSEEDAKVYLNQLRAEDRYLRDVY